MADLPDVGVREHALGLGHLVEVDGGLLAVLDSFFGGFRVHVFVWEGFDPPHLLGLPTSRDGVVLDVVVWVEFVWLRVVG